MMRSGFYDYLLVDEDGSVSLTDITPNLNSWDSWPTKIRVSEPSPHEIEYERLTHNGWDPVIEESDE